MSDGKLKVQQKTKREREIEKFITHRSWRRYTECFEGPQGWGWGWGRGWGWGKQGTGRASSRTWSSSLLGSTGGALWGSQAKT